MSRGRLTFWAIGPELGQNTRVVTSQHLIGLVWQACLRIAGMASREISPFGPVVERVHGLKRLWPGDSQVTQMSRINVNHHPVRRVQVLTPKPHQGEPPGITIGNLTHRFSLSEQGRCATIQIQWPLLTIPDLHFFHGIGQGKRLDLTPLCP